MDVQLNHKSNLAAKLEEDTAIQLSLYASAVKMPSERNDLGQGVGKECQLL